MSNKIRVFISSTMDDLQNERRAVVKRLQTFNMEPVHAETFSPTGGSSWEVIRDKMEQCHICVLILGGNYGWIPDDGYGAGQGKSVTHLEFDLARSLGIPVMTFKKKLSYGAKKDDRRDAFWSEVSNWEGGLFRTEFDWADDLEDKVSNAVADLLMDSFIKQNVRKRDANIIHAPTFTPNSHAGRYSAGKESQWVLVAGAGLSLSAGYPSALALSNVLATRLWPPAPDLSVLARHTFSEIAAFMESRRGRSNLLQTVQEAMNTPQVVKPTVAHEHAVTKFKAIVTTNFDTLFELACIAKNVPFKVVTPHTADETTDDGTLRIFKLNGSITDVESLCLTTSDLLAIEKQPAFKAARKLLASNPVAVVGHSLRDGNMAELMAHRNRNDGSVYVSPKLNELDSMMLERFNLNGVRKSADEYLESFDPI